MTPEKFHAKQEKERKIFESTCQICDRICDKPSWTRIMSETPVYCCKTCKAIWYDGETCTAEIRRHSLNWPVDCYGACRKNSYENLQEKMGTTDEELIAEARANRSAIDSSGIHILCDRLEAANKTIDDLRKENERLEKGFGRGGTEILRDMFAQEEAKK